MSSLIKARRVQQGNAYTLNPEEIMPKVEIAKIDTASGSNNINDEKNKSIIQAQKIIDDAQKEAQGIIENGRLEVEQLKESVKKELETLKKETYDAAYEDGNNQGYEDGYNAGYEKGYQAAYDANKSVAEDLQNVLVSFEEQRQDEMIRSLDDLKLLALEIAGKIIDQRLNDDQDIYLRMIEKALETFRSYSWVDIYINDQPQLAAYIESSLAERMASSSKNLRVRMKEEMPRGFCNVETDAGVVDVSIQTQLEQIKEVLTTNELEA